MLFPSPDFENIILQRVAALEDRNRRLERQNRRMKLAGLVMLLLCGMASLVGARANRDDVIRATRLELYTEDGDLRGKWTADKFGSDLKLYDSHAKVRVLLTAREGMGYIAVKDDRESTCTSMQAFSRGDDDDLGGGRIDIGSGVKKDPSISMKATPNSAKIEMTNKGGEIIFDRP